MERLDAYGRRLGLAFQITDDLLDVEGSADRTGKRVGKDAVRGKLTYPGLLGVEESRRRADRLCREAREQLAPFGPAAAGCSTWPPLCCNVIGDGRARCSPVDFRPK